MDLKNWAIGIAIIILTSFVTIYGMDLLYPQVEYNDYCNESMNVFINNSQQCIAAGGYWFTYSSHLTPEGEAPPKLDPGYCDLQYYCRQEYDNASQARSRNIFFVAIPLGIILIIGGAVIFGLESVGAGLMGGGIVTLIYGAGGYWRYAQQWMKFGLSLLGLIAVIYFAYWFNKRNQKKR